MSITPIYSSRPRLLKSGEDLRIKDPSLEIVTAENAYTQEEIEIFTTGEIKYGLYVQDHIPSLLLDFSVAKYEWFLNVYDLFALHTVDLLPAFRGACSFAVVNSRTFAQTLKREFCFCEEFMEELLQELALQRQTFRNAKQVNMRIEELELTMDTDKMYAIATMYTIAALPESTSTAMQQVSGGSSALPEP